TFIFNNITNSIVALKNGNHAIPIDEHIISIIKENTAPEDRILMLGYKCYYYVASDRLSSTKFFYSCNNDAYPDGHQAVVDSVNAELPKLIVIEGGEDPENLFHSYDLYEKIDPLYGIWLLKSN
ncbi:MAG: hypothetical protein IKN97_09860, partial [Lachnospiraceae bacterium]|nr:hypothetical protein [Lachnospiraceae bacterium]